MLETAPAAACSTRCAPSCDVGGAVAPRKPHGAGTAVAESSASDSIRGDAETRVQDETAGSESEGSAGRAGSVQPASEVGMVAWSRASSVSW